MRTFTSVAVLTALVILIPRPSASSSSVGAKPRLRRPIAMALSNDGRRLFVANRSGSLSMLDTSERRLAGEIIVGKSLADLTATSDGRLLAVDEGAGELIVLSTKDDSPRVIRRIPVPATPVCVRSDGDRRYVTSLWPRQLTVFERDEQRGTIDVPFAPRMLLPLSAGKLLVADSFGGKVAVVDVPAKKVDSIRTLDAHAVRGLGVAGDRVLLAHQVLLPRTPTTAEEMHWGNVVHQAVRSLPTVALQTPGADVLRGGEVRPLGEPGRGAGDPSGLAIAPDGTIVVTLGGVGEVMFGKDKDVTWQRLEVGRRPTAVVLSANGRQAYVADTSGDAIAFVDLANRKVEATVSLGVQSALNAEERGERLFYDSRLSREGWMSCHSCHTDGHSNGGLSDTLSDGGFGAPKRVLTLLGVGDTGPWTWIGGSPDLEGQVRKSLQTTMRSLRVRDEQVRDLVAFMRTLTPPPPAHRPDLASVGRGKEVFDRQGCAKCHTPPTYTTPKTYDVGVHDEAGNLAFNPPSLRGVSQAGPYFHDGRAETLEDVFTRHRHPSQTLLSRGEVDDLVNYLRSL
jgi:DNA-binding beta-propeller fold protein YncE/mono/diheme cytochrome c family protein